MKVLLINGSPRKEGNTFTALSEISRQLATHGIESSLLWVGNSYVRGCIACGKCREAGSNRCIFDDDVTNKVIAEMESCDALIIGAPVYYGQPSSQALALQQRMLYAANSVFAGKPAA
ncbi:MAG: flavodoxin family protein, partial [Bacteroidales bacterium]|nr:flavodoxin family protein [Bacteroidales bacterium]